LGIPLDTTSSLDITLVNSLVGKDTILAGDAGVNGIVGLAGDNYTVPDMDFYNAGLHAVVPAGGISDNITVIRFVFSFEIITHFFDSIFRSF
jgi:hypothetical protein